MSAKRQQSSQQLLQQQQLQQQQTRQNAFSKSQNFSQTYTLYMNNNNANNEVGLPFGGTTPEKKPTNNNNNYGNNDHSSSSYLKGQRIAIVNNKHQQIMSNQQPQQQTSLSARPHYNQQLTQQQQPGSSINALIGSYSQIQNKVNIPTISPMRNASNKQGQNQVISNRMQQQPQVQQQNQTINSSTKKQSNVTKITNSSGGGSSQAVTTRIDLSKSIQDTYNFLQQQQLQQQQQQTQPQNPQIVINQQIQSQDDGVGYAREKIKKLKEENKKLHSLLLETEEKFKSKLDQTRKDSQNVMKVFNQILPILKSAVTQQANQQVDVQEAQNIIKFLELSSSNTSSPANLEEQRQPNNTPTDFDGPQQFKFLQDKVQSLEDEVCLLKETNVKYLKYIQQQMNSSKLFELEIQKLRKENIELLAFKKSIDLYMWSNISTNEQQMKSLNSDSLSTLNMPTNYQNNTNIEPPPSFLKASLLISENYTDSNNDDQAEFQIPNDQLEFYQQTSGGTTGHSPLRTSDQIIEDNLKNIMPNAMKKSRSSSSPFTMNNNYIKYNV